MPIMVDIETMGTEVTAPIVAIGAVRFSYDGNISDEFLTNITLKSNAILGRIIEPETVEWWLQQDKVTQDSLSIPEPVGLGSALSLFHSFVGKEKSTEIWASGASFDLGILRHAFGCVPPLRVPWGYRNEMCLRPMRLLGNMLEINYSEFLVQQKTIKHNALLDARVQALYLCKVLAVCKWRAGSSQLFSLVA